MNASCPTPRSGASPDTSPPTTLRALHAQRSSFGTVAELLAAVRLVEPAAMLTSMMLGDQARYADDPAFSVGQRRMFVIWKKGDGIGRFPQHRPTN